MVKETKAVDIDGTIFDVDMTRANSWTAARMIANINNAKDDVTRGAYAIQFADYVLADEMQKVVDACGGADAPAEKVIDLAYRVITAASKN